jgi:uncharacterized protein YqgV (UPF0045/DUF77 family)
VHSFSINASIQLLRLVYDRHADELMDKVIAVIQQFGIRYQDRSFSTVVDGTCKAVVAVALRVNVHEVQRGCAEWITAVKIQLHSGGPIPVMKKQGTSSKQSKF